MDELAWLVVLVLAFPVMALAALVTGLRQRGRIRRLEARVGALEAQLAAGAPPSDRPAAPELPAPPRDHPRDVRPPPTFPAPAFPTPATAGRSWDPRRLRESFAGFEEKLGARWAVWLGGIALALGGVFLVRFAVEQDLIGPAARIGLGLALAAALLAGGEWLRRLESPPDGAPAGPAPAPGPNPAYVPGVLTAAGTMTAFGSIFAGYELYHLIPPPLALLLLALTGLATLLAALLHGPALAALGFVGAAVTPFLITTSDPDAWGVALLIAVVGASALAVARLRRWRWLAGLALAGMGAWGLTLLAFAVPQAVPASGALGLVVLALGAGLLTPGLLWGPEDTGAPDAIVTSAAAVALAVTLAAAVAGEVAPMPLLVFLLAGLGAVVLAWRAPAATFAAPLTALAAPAVLAAWVFPPAAATAIAPGGPLAGTVPEPARLALGPFMAYGFTLGAVFAGLGFLAALRTRRRLVALGWAAMATLGPLLLLVAAYGRLGGLERSLPCAGLGLGLALVFTLAAEQLGRAGRQAASAAFAAGGVVALALALAFALEKGWLTVGLALAALAVAWVSTRRPLPGLRQLAAGLGLVVLARIGWDPTIAGADLGRLPVLNWLLWGYGVPAAAFAAAAHLLGRRGDDGSRRILEGLALLFAVLLAAFEVRHLAHGGEVYAAGTVLFETGLLASIYGAYAIGLARLAAVTGRRRHRIYGDIMAAVAALCAVNGLVAGNPFLTGETVGGLLFNDLLVAYGLPAALALGFAAGLPPERRRLRLAANGLALVLALAYLTFEVSRLFQGPVLNPDRISAAEWYAYSAVWLGFGIALLGLGLRLGSRSLRLASAAVTGATVLKVFISDMADLEGVLRAVSFIGLGLVLVAMGWLYQRLLAVAKPRAGGS